MRLHGSKERRIRVTMLILIIEVQACGGTGHREVVDADPGQDLGVSPGVVVSPVVQLFVEPGEEAGGA